MPKVLIILLVAASLSACSSVSREWDIAPQEKRSIGQTNTRAASAPNIILIIADDLGKSELSTYGSKDISTPHIDAIGHNGVLFNDAYVTSPVCAPSRAAILTGQYQQRFGFETQPMEYYPGRIKYALAKNAKRLGDWNVVTPPSYPSKEMMRKQGIPLGQVTLPELLQARGYQTALIGKWHLGYGDGYRPNDRGFDYFYGFLGAFSRYTADKKSPGYHTFVQDDFSSEYQWKVGRSENAAILRNDTLIEEKEYLTFAMTREAKQYISAHKQAPFYLQLAYNAPHVPFQAPDEYYDQFPHIQDENRRIYLAMIKALDEAVGDLIHHLEQEGVLENTLILFISDNGGASYTKATDNTPLKGGKLTLFEGGVNVPFMMQWNGHIQPGQRFVPTVSALDIFPTCIAAAEVGVMRDQTMDGQNLLKYVNGQLNESTSEAFFWRADHVRAVRYGRWKMIMSTRDNWLEIYNLDTDKSESIDLSPIRSDEKVYLMDIFEGWNKQLPEKPLWPRIMDRKFVIGGKTYYFPA